MFTNHPKSMVFLFFLILALFHQPLKANEGPVEKEWTFLLFLNGHNNLDYFSDFNVNQMEEVGSSDQVNMVVQWASLKNQDTKRLYIQKDSNLSQVTSPAVEILSPVDMGDYQQLIDFIRWGVAKYPAKKYMLAVWNHGNGWYLPRTSLGARDISYDDLSGNHITTEQLGMAMAEAAKIIGHKVDIYGSDACLMAMAEVAAEMKDSVSFMVGSEEVEPGYGWPYNTWMKRWVENSRASADEVAKALTEEYLKAYDGGIYGYQDVTFSTMDLSHLDTLMSSVKALNVSLTELSANDLKTVEAAANATQSFTYDDYRDLGEFGKRVAASSVGIHAGLFTDLNQAISQFVVLGKGTGIYKEVSGVSVWIPTSDYDLRQHQERYAKLNFNQNTQWLLFLQKLNK